MLICPLLPFILLDMQFEGLRQQLQAQEDEFTKGRKELTEAHRELQECAKQRDEQRKAALDLRRVLGDETREKEALRVSNEELRSSIKRAEGDNSRYGHKSCYCRSAVDSMSNLNIRVWSSLRRAVEEREQKVAALEQSRSSTQHEASALRSSMRELERSRLQACRQLQELRRQVTLRMSSTVNGTSKCFGSNKQVRILEGENSRQKQELLELQAGLRQEEQKEEGARREALALKQTWLEFEAGRQALLNEVEGKWGLVCYSNNNILVETPAYVSCDCHSVIKHFACAG